MKNKAEITAYTILELLYNEMVKEGRNNKGIYVSTDDIVTGIPDSSRELVMPIIKKCIADGFLELFTSDGYQLTDQGKGVVISLNKKKEIEKQKKFGHKISDYFQKRSGIFIPLNFAISLTALFVAMYKIFDK